jgi:tetratricopeptide (TPR) repeat protein
LIIGSFLAVTFQMTYRVPGGRLLVLIPLVNVALGALHGLLMLKAILWRRGARDPLRTLVLAVERASAVAIVVFLLYSIILALNGVLYASMPYVEASEVVAMSGSRTELFGRLPYAWADLRSWRASGQVERVLLVREEWRIVWGGAPVVVQLRKGYFNIPWIAHIEPDLERQSQQILRLAPHATLPHYQLTYVYLSRRQWEHAKAAAITYIDSNPEDTMFPRHVAELLGEADRVSDVVAVLEHVRRPDYDIEVLLGRALATVGRTADGVTHLQRATVLQPEEPDAYRELGAIRLTSGDTAGAVAFFEKTLQLQPRSPDVRATLRRLKP